MYLGDFVVDAVVDAKWTTQNGSGASITRSTDGSIRLYKDNSTTQRSSAAGITDTEDFDSLTGVHHLRIDLGDNTDAGFYAAGHEYQVVLEGAVIDGQTVNAALFHFSIERELSSARRIPLVARAWSTKTSTNPSSSLAPRTRNAI